MVIFIRAIGGNKMHGFQGYMIKVGDRIFPNKYILFDTWSSNPDQRTDQDSYTDGNGKTVRNILPHVRTKVTFQTPPQLHLADKIEMQSFFNRDDTTLTYWNDEKNEYVIGNFYMVDPQFPIRHVIDDGENSDIIYNSISIEIIEY